MLMHQAVYVRMYVSNVAMDTTMLAVIISFVLLFLYCLDHKLVLTTFSLISLLHVIIPALYKTN